MSRKRAIILAGALVLAAIVIAASALVVRGPAQLPGTSAPSAQTARKGPPVLNSPMQQVAAQWKSGEPNFFHTEGNKIVDSHGKEVRLTGINWFGMETGTFAPHGLWERNWEDMLDQMTELGYNTLRLPYSNQMFDPRSLPEGVDFEMNPDLRGLKPLEIMDKIVEAAGKRGMRVILDRHRPDIEKQRELWYTEDYPEERWIADWLMLAERYKGNDTVIGADLHNEPHGEATWGSGDLRTDWRLAAERCGNAILAVNPDWLILVEGTEVYDSQWFWWGANLLGAAKYPVRLDVPNKLVYSPHEYGPGVWNQSWFKDKSYPSNLPQIWEKHWGYLHDQNVAPILVGEFGGRRVDNDSPEGQWQQALLSYLEEKGMHFTYWAFNANSGDTGGVLDEEDVSWRAVVKDKVEYLKGYQWPMLVSGTADEVNLAAAPSYDDETTARAKLHGDLRVRYHPAEHYNFEGTNATSPSIVPAIRVINMGVDPVSLAGLEVRYWFKGEGAQQADVEFASVGAANVRAEVDPNPGPGGQRLLKLTFAEDAGEILGKGGNVDLEVRITNAAGAKYAQVNDYSFDTRRTELNIGDFLNWERVVLYQAGQLVWGAEPLPK